MDTTKSLRADVMAIVTDMIRVCITAANNWQTCYQMRYAQPSTIRNIGVYARYDAEAQAEATQGQLNHDENSPRPPTWHNCGPPEML